MDTRDEPAQVFVDAAWAFCVSIKQFNIEFKVRAHLGDTMLIFSLTQLGEANVDHQYLSYHFSTKKEWLRASCRMLGMETKFGH